MTGRLKEACPISRISREGVITTELRLDRVAFTRAAAVLPPMEFTRAMLEVTVVGKQAKTSSPVSRAPGRMGARRGRENQTKRGQSTKTVSWTVRWRRHWVRPRLNSSVERESPLKTKIEVMNAILRAPMPSTGATRLSNRTHTSPTRNQ